MDGWRGRARRDRSDTSATASTSSPYRVEQRNGATGGYSTSASGIYLSRTASCSWCQLAYLGGHQLHCGRTLPVQRLCRRAVPSASLGQQNPPATALPSKTGD
ncbi:hypothetical protein RvY_03907-2 [Ramazzottius varieornatus]|uniref:Uncharacterized protein n=1 Tax=Ramazzottius varieornatus TaxID=947166 RepID=A0A1D1UT64_RAMVA|nr:hypothetical protein RvY_03907-2 [Ramazzottius varieornatus]